MYDVRVQVSRYSIAPNVAFGLGKNESFVATGFVQVSEWIFAELGICVPEKCPCPKRTDFIKTINVKRSGEISFRIYGVPGDEIIL